jgi:hypothetical protein
MNTPPPLMRDQRAVDREHLRLLAIFHFVVAGLALAGIGFLFLHYSMMHMVFDNPQMWQPKPNQPPMPSPQDSFTWQAAQKAQLMAVFQWFYLIAGAFLVLAAVGNLLSGLFIRKRKHREFSIVIAALNCLQIPFGTVLGVFTIVVLVRDSVSELYSTDPSSN